MTAFSKADIQNVCVGTELDVCSWPKADLRHIGSSLGKRSS